MKQSAAERPDPTLQRKAAIVNGGVVDHAGRVRIEPIPDFDLDRTIFQTLEGKLPRFVMSRRIAKRVHFDKQAAKEIQTKYEVGRATKSLPTVPPELIRFLVDECDFDAEHAEGSFLDHLYFGYEYSAQHYPEHSPLVMLLHSILGTGTNTFAMEAGKIPRLRELIDDFVWRQVEAFPSVLRLLYDRPLREELLANAHRPGALKEIGFHRVIDNAPITMSGEDFWIQMNYQIMHVLDFLPAANWSAHHSDNSFVLFRSLYEIMTRAGTLDAKIQYKPPSGARRFTGETADLGTRLIALVPDRVIDRMAGRSVRKFSERIGHSLNYNIVWG